MRDGVTVLGKWVAETHSGPLTHRDASLFNGRKTMLKFRSNLASFLMSDDSRNSPPQMSISRSNEQELFTLVSKPGYLVDGIYLRLSFKGSYSCITLYPERSSSRENANDDPRMTEAVEINL